MDQPDAYRLALSQHLARSLRLYGSLSSSLATPPATTTSSQTIAISTPSSLQRNTLRLTGGTTSNTENREHPYFWPLVLAKILSLLSSLLTNYILPFFRKYLIPVFVVWLTYKLFVIFHPDARGILSRNPQLQQFEMIQRNLPRDAELVGRRLRWNFFWDGAGLYSSRIQNFFKQHRFACLLGSFIFWFSIHRLSALTSYKEPQGDTYDLHGKGFKIPDYMVWGKKEEGSNHVRQFRREEWGKRDTRANPTGQRGFKREYERVEDWSVGVFEDDGDVLDIGAGVSLTCTTSTSSSSSSSSSFFFSSSSSSSSSSFFSSSSSSYSLLSEVETTSSTPHITTGPTGTTSSIESTVSASGGMSVVHTADKGRYDGDGLAFCRKCRQKHCCEIS